MPFPESPRVIYGQNPLVEVICQLRYPPILRIRTGELADFQDKIRQDYPLCERQEPVFEFQNVPNMPKEVRALAEQMPWPKGLGSTTHKFLTKDSARFISLAEDFVALTETRYTRWEHFRAEMERADKAVRELYKPTFYSRIGLRYRDLVRPQALGFTIVKWSELLKPHIIGELADLNVRDVITDIKTRCVMNVQEVTGGRVTLTHGFYREGPGSQVSYLIDADFAAENVEVLDETFNILDRFNKLAGRLFRWAITDTLHDAMGPESI